MSTYEVRTVSRTGALQTDMQFANPTRITKLLNEPYTASVRFPLYDYGVSDINTFDDIQIYRNGGLLFWGVVWDIQVSSATNEAVASCGDYNSVLRRLNLDRPRSNNLANGSFESGTTAGWFNNTPGMVTSIVTSPVARGDFALRLANPTPWTDRSWQQNIEYPAIIDRRSLSVAGYFRLEQRVSLATASFEQRGLYMQMQDLATGEFIYHDFVPIDPSYEANIWHRTPAMTHSINPGVGRRLNVRLYGPGVPIIWDEISVTRNEPLVNTAAGPGSNEDDITDIVAVAIHELQEVANNGKTNLQIGSAGANTGVTEYISIPRFEHMPFDRFLSQFIDRDDGIDTSIQITPTTKTFRVWPSPGMGDDISGSVTLEYGDTLAAYTCTKSGSDTTSRMTVTAAGDGMDREEAEEADTTFTNGLTLQDVRPAVESAKLKSIDRQARGWLRASKKPVRKFDLWVKDPDLIPVIGLGDTIHVNIDDGWTQVNEDMRVIAWDLDCPRDILMVTAHEPTNQ